MAPETLIQNVGKITYYFDNEMGTLVKEEQNYPKAISEGVIGKSNFKVLAFIENISFSYYYFNSEIQAYDWKSSWSVGEGIPTGVKVEVTFKDGKRNVELDRTVLIPISG